MRRTNFLTGHIDAWRGVPTPAIPLPASTLSWDTAFIGTVVIIIGIAIIAGFIACFRLTQVCPYNPITTSRHGATIAAGIGIDLITVVARFEAFNALL